MLPVFSIMNFSVKGNTVVYYWLPYSIAFNRKVHNRKYMEHKSTHTGKTLQKSKTKREGQREGLTELNAFLMLLQTCIFVATALIFCLFEFTTFKMIVVKQGLAVRHVRTDTIFLRVLALPLCVFLSVSLICDIITHFCELSDVFALWISVAIVPWLLIVLFTSLSSAFSGANPIQFIRFHALSQQISLALLQRSC